MWQAEADTELTLSASPATAVGQSKLYPGESRLEYGISGERERNNPFQQTRLV